MSTIRYAHLDEMPLSAISQGSMHFNKTGSWRYLRPVNSRKEAPCMQACPAGTDIPELLDLVSRGKLREAYALTLQTNPLPATCSRVCFHPCQSSCSRLELDSSVQVREVERAVADFGLALSREGPAAPRSERVAIVGAGPAGLSCAYFLARRGLRPTIFDRNKGAGGLLRTAIPAFRLPREVLGQEIAQLEHQGIRFRQNCEVGRDVPAEELLEDFDAVFLAGGAQKCRQFPLAEAGPAVLSGLEFLSAVSAGRPPLLGEVTVVIGGGNTALDAARTAMRLGSECQVVYRRTRKEMPANDEEILAAAEEGVDFLFLASPRRIEESSQGMELQFDQMTLGEPDSSGRARPIPVPGARFTLAADQVIVAIGEEIDLAFAEHLLSDPGVFLGGDAATGPATVPAAIGSGRQGAADILDFLDIPSDLSKLQNGESFQTRWINWDYFPSLDTVELPAERPEVRKRDFGEIVETLSLESATLEACRCLSCGTCNQCDNCWTFCPENAIRRVGGRYEIDLDYCKGCGICAEECPRGVITLTEEEA